MEKREKKIFGLKNERSVEKTMQNANNDLLNDLFMQKRGEKRRAEQMKKRGR